MTDYREMVASDIAVENVELVIAGVVTEPSPGTLAARVLDFARNYRNAVVTVNVSGLDVAPL